jgi:hypothetical protein
MSDLEALADTLPAIIGTGAAAVVENADRLGLTWNLRRATVTRLSSGGSTPAVYDGDPIPHLGGGHGSEGIGMISLIGDLGPGTRVAVLEVPPSGNFIVGYALADHVPGFRGGNSTNNGTLVTTAAQAAVPSASWDEEPSITFADQRLYLIQVQAGVFNSAATNSVGRLRVRQGAQTTSGQQLAFWQVSTTTANVSSASVASFSGVAYVKNITGGFVTTQLSLTIERQSGAANLSLYGDSDMPVTVAVTDIGDVGRLTSLAALAAQIA